MLPTCTNYFLFLFKQGINPSIIYTINSTDFALIDGFVFMTAALPEETVFLEVSLQANKTRGDQLIGGSFLINHSTPSMSVQVVATDEPSGETDTALLSVRVTSGRTTFTSS